MRVELYVLAIIGSWVLVGCHGVEVESIQSTILFPDIGSGSGTETTQSTDPPVDCQPERCPEPLCANPITPPGECCPSCKDSLCMFEGCVMFIDGAGDQDVVWKPDKCSNCFCHDNRTLCGIVECPDGPPYPNDVDPPAPCFGFPEITKPWECCTLCDYGFSETQCNVAPPQSRKVTLTSLGTTCETTILEHTKCDKRGFMAKSGRRFRCQPTIRETKVDLEQCSPFTNFRYYDVIECKGILSENLDVGCDLFIESKH